MERDLEDAHTRIFDLLEANHELVHFYNSLLSSLSGSPPMPKPEQPAFLAENSYEEDEKELFHACDLVVDSGADYIKTGTGWIPAPLDLKRIQEIKSHCGSKIKLKVAGGVRTRKEFISLVEMGVERVGINAVSALQIVTELNKHPYCSGEDMLVAK